MQNDDSERDRELDVALARYAAVEPRRGLEQRVLASLRAEQRHPARGLRQWTALAALALAVSIAAVSVIWLIRSKASDLATGFGGASRENVANHFDPAGAGRSEVRKPGLQIGRLPGRVPSTQHRTSAEANHPKAHEPVQDAIAAEAAPKLERFPAPEPLSEQERLLLRLVEKDPDEAQLVAQQLKREDEEMAVFGPEAERAQGEQDMIQERGEQK